MKIRGKHILTGVIVFNVALLLFTFGLSRYAEMQHPMQGKLIDASGINIHAIESTPDNYDVREDSVYDAVVLVHGSSTSSLDFTTNLLPELSKNHKVVALDRPGHGYSERGNRAQPDNPKTQADILFDALEEMNISKPVLIGHSWAGSVVLAALLSDREDIVPAAGVLISGVTHPYEREDSTPTKLSLKPFVGPIFRWQYLVPMGRLAMPSTVERFFSPDAVPDNYIEQTGLNLSLRPSTYLHNARDRSNLSGYLMEQSQDYAQINYPILSIAATGDHVVPPQDHHNKLAATLNDIVTISVEGAGHSPHHTRKEEVVLAINKFIENLN